MRNKLCFNQNESVDQIGVFTADGRLYMWGKNSHVIAVSHAPSKAFFHPVAVDQDEQLGVIHSVHCGSWHAVAVTGQPGETSRLLSSLCLLFLLFLILNRIQARTLSLNVVNVRLSYLLHVFIFLRTLTRHFSKTRRETEMDK